MPRGRVFVELPFGWIQLTGSGRMSAGVKGKGTKKKAGHLSIKRKGGLRNLVEKWERTKKRLVNRGKRGEVAVDSFDPDRTNQV